MSAPYQECALYGELVRHLRDCAAELLACADQQITTETATQQLDEVIRAWFFTPQQDLMGLAPRDVIWAEQTGRANPVPPDRVGEMFDDDCPICQAMRADAERDMAEGHAHGWQWHYDDGGFPLIAEYDRQGWDARWASDVDMSSNEFTQTWSRLLDDSQDDSEI